MKTIFITGSDTDIGKTFVSVGLCLSNAKKGLKVGYFKPFQSGAYVENGVLIAPDIDEFKNYTEIACGYSYLLEGEVSPYYASKISNVKFDFEKVQNDIRKFSSDKDLVIVEGAGGLYCPVAKRKVYADIIKKLDFETIVVSTPSLGRINHLLMTLECASLYNINIKGIIVNKMPKKQTLSEENFVNELKDFTAYKVLGVIPKLPKPTKEKIIEAFENINL